MSQSLLGQVEVRWPASGVTRELANVAPNQIVEITGGNPLLVQKHYETALR